MNPLFELVRVTAGYRGRQVLTDVSLSIGRGEFVSIIGPNGAGKSTLLRVMAGEILPVSGEVRFSGRPLRRWGVREKARAFSYVAQTQERLAPYTVHEFIMMGRFPHRSGFGVPDRADREAAQWAAEQAGVEALADRPLTSLSGGELQMVRIAHALAQNRHVIILDEPVSHLDIAHAVGIMDILWKLHRDGSTVVTVLHDINLASDYSTRIVGIRGGSVFFSGSPNEVLRYDLLEALFGTPCIVIRNPTTGRPFVYPVPGYLT